MHQHEQAQTAESVTTPSADHDVAPGRGTSSSTLTAPSAPVISGLIQRKARDANGVAAGADEAVAEASSAGGGQSLPTTVMRKFESSLGTDLSGVRVHTGAQSQAAASAVGAKAYTVGQDIHFGAGQYNPGSEGGQHLLAHEVAHTVQQRGGQPTRQNKLEVSSPQDSAEREADRAADAMVSGAPASISGAPVTVSRDKDVNDTASQGEQDMAKIAAKEDLVLKVSNATDITDASKALNLLEDNQRMVEKGMAMISPHQTSLKGAGQFLENLIRGKANKPLTQVPVEAYAQNAAVINDLKLYIVAGGGQSMVTTGFQAQYAQLLANYGRVEGLSKNYGGMSLKDMKGAGDATGMVGNAVGAGGHKTSDLAALFQELMKDPKVSGARERVQLSTAELEKMPPRVSGDMTGVVSATQTFMSAIHTATTAEKGVHSLTLRNAYQAAKAKAEEAKKLTGSVKELVITGTKTTAQETAKALVGVGKLTLAKVSEAGAASAATGGTAVAMAAADKLVIGPAKAMLAEALTNANAAVGIIDPAAQLDANIDAEAAKQDSATIESFKLAKATLASSEATLSATLTTWVKTAVEYELKKLEVTKNFTALEEAIKSAAGAKGKGKQGKALAEMTGFLHEAEQFVVQANTVLDIAQKGDIGAKDAKSITSKAREALEKIKHRMVWMVHTYPFTDAKGETKTYYGAQEVNMKIIGPGLAPTAEEAAGAGRADGFQLDGNKHAANEALPAVIPNVTTMRDKVMAVRAAIMSQVFGTGGA